MSSASNQALPDSKIGRKRGAFFWTVAGRIVQILLGLGTLKLQTAYLSKSQVGEYGLFLNIVTFFVFIAVRPLTQFFSRQLHEWYEHGNLSAALTRIIGIELALSFLMVPAIALCTIMLSIHSNTPLYVWALVWSFWFFFYSVFNTVVPAFNLLDHKLEWMIGNSTGLGLGLLIGWFAMVVKPNAVNWTLSLALGFAVSSVLAAFKLFLLARQQPQAREKLKSVISIEFLIPATVAIGGTWIQFQAFRLLVVNFVSLDEYGLFSAGYGLAAGVIAAFEGLAAQYLQPYFYAGLAPGRDSASKNKHWSIFAGTMVSLTGATSLLAVAYGPLLCRFLLSNEFQKAWPYFFVGIFIEGLRVISGTIALGTHVTLKVQRSLRSYWAGIIALVIGFMIGEFQHSLTAFTAIVISGCLIHIFIIAMDVSEHLGVRIKITSGGYLLVLFAIVTAFVIAALMKFSFGVQLGLIGIASILYLIIIFNLVSRPRTAN